jgi:hypothetical protein
MSSILYTYKTVSGADGNIISIQRSDGASIPIDPKNSDYQMYQLWIDEGNISESSDNIRSDYRAHRALEYPSIGDQLDALFHAGLMPLEMAIKIQAVKAKYPKV